MGLALSGASAPLLDDGGGDGTFTSSSAGGGPSAGGTASGSGSGGAGGVTSSPNLAVGGTGPSNPNAAELATGQADGGTAIGSQPNDVPAPSVDPCVVAILGQTNANAVYGVGFALEAVDHPGYCVAAVDAGLGAGSTLQLARCTNVLGQQWGWSRGQMALAKRMCVTGGSGNGSPLTLQACAASATQVWAMPVGLDVPRRTLADGQTVQAWAIDQTNPTGANLLGQPPATATGLRLRVGALPQTDGVRVHARVNGTDLCLADSQGGASFTGCSNAAAQVWRTVADQWRSALGNCLVGDASAATVGVGACSARPADSARWGLAGGFITFGGASGAASLVLDVDGGNAVPRLGAPAGLTPAYAFGAPTGLF